MIVVIGGIMSDNGTKQNLAFLGEQNKTLAIFPEVRRLAAGAGRVQLVIGHPAVSSATKTANPPPPIQVMPTHPTTFDVSRPDSDQLPFAYRRWQKIPHPLD